MIQVNSTYALQIAYRDSDVDAAKAAGERLGELLHPRTRREANGLFAELKRDETFTEHVASLCAEHAELDVHPAAIDAGELARIPALITLLNNHIDREENGLFPAALAFLDDAQWDTIQRPALMAGSVDEHSHPHEV